jgi:hypothetical protein
MMLEILQMKLLPALTVRLGTVGIAVRIAITGSYVIRNLYRGNLRERDQLGDPGVDGRIILRWIFRK